MNEISIGKIYRFRKNNDFIIARDKYGEIIQKFGRPLVVFYSDDKVYYLSVKSLTKSNKKMSIADNTNVIVPNGVYGYGNSNVISCASINIMDKKLFESLFEIDNELNNYSLNRYIYNDVMNKLFENMNNIRYFEVDHFDFDNNQTIWKLEEEAIKNKPECEKVMKKYRDLTINTKLLNEFENDDDFYSFLKEEYMSILLEYKKNNINKNIEDNKNRKLKL
ncbi:Mbov_0400 family ICE element protein [Metamycoplasma alkalescens]|uniref:Mbov_0400 family ICE element protein n=1 Tax=Metamycoplasma alkalescens TaxID=45363 RepID=UPI003CFF5FCB